MPELPEVEAARRAIEENCIGKKIKRSVVADDAKVIDGVSPSDFEASLTGKTIVAAHRKGKNMWIQLDSPPYPSFQFGMAGAIYIKGVAVTKYKRSAVNDTDEWPSKYSKLFIELDDGLELSFTDKRRFAKVRLLKNPASVAPISELGPDALLEPLTEDELFESLSKKKIGIKALILDQSFISGVGNWIADEVLYQARIHPLQSAASISKENCAALHKSLKEVIEQAVEVGADSSQFPSNWIFHSRENKPGKAFVDDNMDSPQPASSTASSSSSIDTDELLQLQRKIFVGLVREAAKSIYGSTASSSRREPRAGNIERGKKIEFINAGGRTSAFVPELQKLSGEQAAKAAVKPQKRSSKKNKDEEDEPESSEDEEIAKNAKPKGGKKTTQGRAKNPNTKRKSIGSDEGSSDADADADDDKKPATRKKPKGSEGNKKPPAKNAQESEEDSDDEGEEEGEEEERVQVKGKKEVAKKVQTGKQIKKRVK